MDIYFKQANAKLYSWWNTKFKHHLSKQQIVELITFLLLPSLIITMPTWNNNQQRRREDTPSMVNEVSNNTVSLFLFALHQSTYKLYDGSILLPY
jgi:hypothetical protein